MWRLLALSATAGVGIELPSPPEPACGQTEGTVCIIAAARDLAPGTVIQQADLQPIELPAGFVPIGAAKRAEHAVGRTLRESILAGELVREERLADPDRGQGLSALLYRGEQLVTLVVQPSSFGALSPLHYVDVLVGARTVAEGVRVLGVDLERSEVALALPPGELPPGPVRLTLRNDMDITGVVTHGALTRDTLPEATTVKELMARTRKSKDTTCYLPQGRAYR